MSHCYFFIYRIIYYSQPDECILIIYKEIVLKIKTEKRFFIQIVSGDRLTTVKNGWTDGLGRLPLSVHYNERKKMGRYYSGDIEGKFWFGVQSSDDASFFGGLIEEPTELNYHFNTRKDMKKVVSGLEECRKKLGANKELLDKFFKDNDSYNNKMIQDAYGWSEKEVREHLEWYARLDLGEKIYNCLKEQDDCYFSAEC